MLNQICILGQSPKYLVMINYPLFMLLYFICWHPLNVWRLRSWGVLAPDFLWFYIISVSPHWVSVAVCGHSLVAARGAALPAVCSLLTAGTSLVAARGLWSVQTQQLWPRVWLALGTWAFPGQENPCARISRWLPNR